MSDRKRMREIVLARRALFVASALHGVNAHAQDNAQQEGPPPIEPPPPPRVTAIACLSPPPPTHRQEHDAIDLAAGVTPAALLTPLYTTGRPYVFGTAFALGVRREFTSSIDVSLLATIAPSPGDSPFAPLGGTLRLATTALTPREWDPEYRLVSSIDLGGGTWLSPSARPTGDRWETTRGPWLAIGSTLIGIRLGLRRDRDAQPYGIEIGVPAAFVLSTQRSSTDERFGLSYFTIGLNFSFFLQRKAPTSTRVGGSS